MENLYHHNIICPQLNRFVYINSCITHVLHFVCLFVCFSYSESIFRGKCKFPSDLSYDSNIKTHYTRLQKIHLVVKIHTLVLFNK